tara:strand:+ start:945 stop:4508 length:3564 start_codon:yes stop_codon:yes gene_type:complete
MGNGIKNRVFGSDVPNKIKKKIESRQLLASQNRDPNAEINPSAYPDSRTSGGGSSNEGYYTYKELNKMNYDGVADLSSRTPFIRMWTAVTVSEDVTLGEISENEHKVWLKSDNQFVSNEFVVKTDDDKLELHQWDPFDKFKKIYEIGNHVLSTLERNPNDPITTSIKNEKNKEITADVMRAAIPHEQESDMNQFLKPAAGITGLSSATEGALGTIKKTTVNFVVHNFSDFENIYLRYFLKPGAQVFIDFGWDTAFLYDTEKILDETDVEDALYGDNGYVTKSEGDLETLFGHVVGYDAKIREDGGFDCSVEVVSKNASLVSSGFDEKLKERIRHGLDIEIMAITLSGILGDPILYEKASTWGQDSETQEEMRTVLSITAAKMFGGQVVKLPGLESGSDNNNAMSRLALEHGIFFAGTVEEDMRLFVNFGWFEDKFLNKEFGFSDSKESLLNSTDNDVKNDEASLKAKFNSRNSFCTYNSELAKAMEQSEFRKKSSFIYPGSWGKPIGGAGGNTYNSKISMVPDDDARPDVDIESSEAKEDWGKYIEQKDRDANRIPLREIFLSVEMIKESIDITTSSSEFFAKLIERISDSSGGIVELGLTSNSYGQNNMSFVDKNMLIDDSVKKATDNADFLKNLLTFKPYTKNTITKGYDLSFSMPKGGLGNMLAVQASNSLGTGQSFNEMLDGFIKQEKMTRDTEGLFTKYLPSIGKESANRLNQNAGTSNTFNFSQAKVLFGNAAAARDAYNLSQINFGISGMRTGDYAHLQRTLNETLKKASKPGLQMGKLVNPPEKKKEAVAEDSTKTQQDIARKNGHTLVNNPHDFWLKSAIDTHLQTTLPLIKIDASLTINGISSLVPGDLIRINYLPKNYYNNAFFQITKIEHSVGTSWDTSITSVMRVAPRKIKGEEQTYRVGKSYLRNTLKLEEIDEFIHLFGNMVPIDLPVYSNSNYPQGVIDNIFIIDVDVDSEEFAIPTLWASGPEEKFKMIIGYANSAYSHKTFQFADSIKVSPKYQGEFDFGGWKSITCGIDFNIDNWKVGKKFILYTSGKKWIIGPWFGSLDDGLGKVYTEYTAKTFQAINAKVSTRKLDAVGTPTVSDKTPKGAAALPKRTQTIPKGYAEHLGYNLKAGGSVMKHENWKKYGFPSEETARECHFYGRGCPSDWRMYEPARKYYPPTKDYETTRKRGPKG